MIRSGAVNDPSDRAGLANLTTSMLIEGTASRSAQRIADEIEFLGSHLRASASREHIVIISDGLTSTWRDALDVVGDIAQNAAFPSSDLERVRANLLTDLRRVSDNPATISARATRGVMYGSGTPYGHPLTGAVASVELASADDLRAFFRAHLSPSNATLIIVGDLSLDQAMAAAQDTFGDWTGSATANGAPSDPATANGAQPAPTPTAIYLADKPGAAQSVIRTGHLTIPRADRRFMALNVFNYIFGGQFGARLNMNLRQDKGYSYGYMSSIDWSLGPSMLIAGGGVQTAVTKEAVIETLKEFEGIVGDEPVTPTEFRDAIDGILRGVPSQFETQFQIISQLSRIVTFDLPDDYFAQFPAKLAQTTLEDVRRAGSDLLDVGNLNIVIAGDADAIRPGLEELGLPIVEIDYEGNSI